MPNNILDNHLLEDEADAVDKLLLKFWQQSLLIFSFYMIPYLLIRYLYRSWSINQFTPVGDLLLQGILVTILGNITLLGIQTIQQKRIPFIPIQFFFEQNIKISLLVGLLVGGAIRLVTLVLLMIWTSILEIQNIENFFADFFVIDIIIAIIDSVLLSFYLRKKIGGLTL